MTLEANDYTGRCTCSRVTYRLTSKPMFVHCCHCTWCQREAGGAHAVNALIEADRVEVMTGTPEAIPTPSSTGKGQLISRCPECKVALFSNYAYAGIGEAVRFVRVGTLDDPSLLPPDIHIFTASKQPWVALDPGVPAVPEYYKASEYWPRASLDRRSALFETSSEGAPQAARTITSQIDIEVHGAAHPDEEALVRSELDRFNRAAGPFDQIQLLRCFARAASGELIGAAIGHTWGRSCELGQLWVSEPRRRQGLGSKLIARFEREAESRGCDLIYLDTFSFHAPEFYALHGYEVACELGGLPEGAVLFILRKPLAAA